MCVLSHAHNIISRRYSERMKDIKCAFLIFGILMSKSRISRWDEEFVDSNRKIRCIWKSNHVVPR